MAKWLLDYSDISNTKNLIKDGVLFFTAALIHVFSLRQGAYLRNHLMIDT